MIAIPRHPSKGRGDGVRDVRRLVVRRAGRVEETADPTLPWKVDGRADVEPVNTYLRALVADGNRPATCRSYGYDLLRWLRFLAAVGVPWDHASRDEVRDLVLWLKVSDNPQRRRRRAGAPLPGAVNPLTGKAHLPSGYGARTINHNLSVLRAFYDWHLGRGDGPLVNPVPDRSRRDGRRFAHHNPMEPFRHGPRAELRQKEPRRQPRAVPDEVFDALFEALGSDRDRALVALYLSTAARAAELLGCKVGDIDYGRRVVWVVTKGGDDREPVPASADSFVWLALYLSSQPERGPHEALWWTRRRPHRPLTYTAARAVLLRADATIGANVSLHDLRHTAAMRMIADPALSLTDVQTVLRHRHLGSTEVYLRARVDEVIARVQAHQDRPPAPTRSPSATGYDPADLAVLFGTR